MVQINQGRRGRRHLQPWNQDSVHHQHTCHPATRRTKWEMTNPGWKWSKISQYSQRVTKQSSAWFTQSKNQSPGTLMLTASAAPHPCQITRGIHDKDREDPLDSQAVWEIQMDCACNRSFSHPRHTPSVHILADSRLQNWPVKDKFRTIDYHPGWNFKTWIAVLRAETIRIKTNTVVIYLERCQEYEDVPPIKNSLHTMCKTIRQHQQGAKIFVANFLPRVTSSPISRPLGESSFILLQAVRSVNRAMGKINFMSIYEHFISKSGKVIRPTHKYFMQDNVQLTPLGCMVFRECMIHEAGLKGYWFR